MAGQQHATGENLTGEKPVGLIGLGKMGMAITLRLLDSGFAVVAYTREPEDAAQAVEAGATLLDSAAAVADSVETVLLCVTDTAAVRDVALGNGGLSEGVNRYLVVVDLGTTDPEETLRISDAVSASGIRWVDAPVSGGPAAARSGSLTVMVGGPDDVVQGVERILQAIASNHTRMGETGAGQLTKMINQVIVLNNFCVLAEAVRLGENVGIDVDRLPECLAGGFADSVMLQRVLPRMVNRAYLPPTGTSRLVLKDLDLVHELSKRTDTPMPISSVAAEIYRMWVAQGHALEDPITLMDLYAPPIDDS